MKSYDSIRLFKKSRETDNEIQELIPKDDLPNSEQPLSELIITPFEIKDKRTSPQTNSMQSLLSPDGISNVIQKALTSLGIDSKKTSDLFMNFLIRTIFKKPK
ncbi:hypothetical protein [Desulfosporosinus sp.]|uniref:hypothetical protein n=1 Tax=Desulfosporosinus sp. TaxID=157907 RepID=UPI000E7EAEE9|nr:hypothetical protein [Desulfosporosinus sp.]MBC2722595.1 hypothetical protein [Desulfosporosinus sp.]MBC2729007.1 hypothetical protein [Desulfosporosinus sp.]HBV86450.1 hypothetical protein [Desulfosporosinus sp.]